MTADPPMIVVGLSDPEEGGVSKGGLDFWLSGVCEDLDDLGVAAGIFGMTGTTGRVAVLLCMRVVV